MTDVHVEINEVTVCALPASHPNWPDYAIWVIRRRLGGPDEDLWGVARLGDRQLRADGAWVSGRSGGADLWHTYDDALRLAVAAAPDMTVNGRTAREVAEDARAG